MRHALRRSLISVVYATLVLALLAPVGVAEDGPPGGHPVIVVDEDFDDGSADDFFTDTGGQFLDGELGDVVDDGTGNLVYVISEQMSTQAFLPVPAGDFRLTLEATLLLDEGNPGSFGVPGLIFRADPSEEYDGYALEPWALREMNDGGFGDFVLVAESRDWFTWPEPGAHSIAVTAIGQRVKVFWDGRLLLDAEYDGPTFGHIGLVEVNGGIVWIDNVRLSIIPRSETTP